MSIVPMCRVTLCGLGRDKETALDGLQQLGVVHLIPLRPPQPLATADPADRQRARTAFRHIMDAPEQLRPYRSDTAFEVNATVESILASRLRLREFADRRDELQARIADLEPWGEFILPPLDDLAGMRLWLYPLSVKDRPALDRLELPWAVVGRGPTTLHVAVLAREEPAFGLLPAKRIRAGRGPLSRLRAELEDLDIEIEKAEVERAALTRWRLLLGAALADAEDRDARREAAELTRDESGVFALQGWAPKERASALESFAAGRGLALLVEPLKPDDAPPTLLRAPERLGESATDLTSFYTSPGYRGWDPSLVVFVSFAIFFAMILADAGYAMLLGLLTFAFWRRMGASDSGRRFRTLLVALCGASFVYGVAAGSYFGFAPPAGSLLARLDVIDVADFEKMMRVSVVIGALHISIALAAVIWLNRGSGKALAALGWIVVIVGGLLFWLGEGSVAGTVATAALVGGLGAVFWGNGSARPVHRPLDWLLRLSDGILGLTGATKLFGDLLSYLRLFALGLASASLAATFNQIALDIGSRPGVGVLFAILVFLFGHAINLLIGIMSGVVHGLRLNYIEFFGWGLTEEGYPFRPFAKKEKSA